MSDPIDISEATFSVKKADGTMQKFKVTDLVSALSQVNKVALAQAEELKKFREESAVGARNAKPPKDDDKDDDKDGDDDNVDLESMSRKDLVSFILKGVGKQLGDVIKPVATRVEGTERSLRRKELEAQLKSIEDAPDDFPHFDEFTEEIQKMIKQRPDLSLDEAYTLATRNNKDKFEELEQKRQETEKKEDDDDTDDFFGFTPTSGRHGPKKDMTPKDAAEAAWDKEIKGTPAERLLASD